MRLKNINYVNVEVNGQNYSVPFSCMDNVYESDFTNNEFDLDKWTERTGETKIKIMLLKRELTKFKEDVEQVELFGMERADYEEKKLACKNLVLELRELENQIKS